MANVRMLPPGSGIRPTITVNGRTYTAATGTTVDSPASDALVKQANHWVKCADGVGTTAQRPTAPTVGFLYIDTTLSAYVVWDDKAWRNPLTGAVA